MSSRSKAQRTKKIARGALWIDFWGIEKAEKLSDALLLFFVS
jgi:hypothetical protein